jgi:hypothetical protein
MALDLMRANSLRKPINVGLPGHSGTPNPNLRPGESDAVCDCGVLQVRTCASQANHARLQGNKMLIRMKSPRRPIITSPATNARTGNMPPSANGAMKTPDAKPITPATAACSQP